VATYAAPAYVRTHLRTLHMRTSIRNMIEEGDPAYDSKHEPSRRRPRPRGRSRDRGTSRRRSAPGGARLAQTARGLPAANRSAQDSVDLGVDRSREMGREDWATGANEGPLIPAAHRWATLHHTPLQRPHGRARPVGSPSRWRIRAGASRADLSDDSTSGYNSALAAVLVAAVAKGAVLSGRRPEQRKR